MFEKEITIEALLFTYPLVVEKQEVKPLSPGAMPGFSFWWSSFRVSGVQ
jgi:hypothetical protein